jgi:uncharacterized protein (TIGR00730 family)
MNVCVYCSSSDRVAPVYFETATRLGQLLGGRKNNLVYGGSRTGPMGALAEGVKKAGGRVVAVIPRLFEEMELTYEKADEVVVTEDLQERRVTMIKGSDVFLALPGGLGTLEEVCENLTMRQLGFHNKPLAFISTDGYWDTFLEFIRQLTAGKFLLPEHESLIHVVSTPEEALQYVDTFVPAPLPDKWGRSKESSRP